MEFIKFKEMLRNKQKHDSNKIQETNLMKFQNFMTNISNEGDLTYNTSAVKNSQSTYSKGLVNIFKENDISENNQLEDERELNQTCCYKGTILDTDLNNYEGDSYSEDENDFKDDYSNEIIEAEKSMQEIFDERFLVHAPVLYKPIETEIYLSEITNEDTYLDCEVNINFLKIGRL